MTIDTEEDNWGEYQRSFYSVKNIKRIPRIQDVFANRGVRPTYLISYPVAMDAGAIDTLGGYMDAGRCEIGTHLHPWNTPPSEEERTALNSYISNLPSSLQYLKIKALHDAIKRNFGTTPRSYRSGKWGFNEDVAKNLIRLGYTVDTSVFPAWDWSPTGGIDYTRCTHEPFVYEMEPSAGHAGGSLLEVPATIDVIQHQRALAVAAYWTIKRNMPASQTILTVLSKVRVLNHVCLSPEINNASQMIRLSRTLVDRGTKIINLFFHSPSLLPNCSPFVRTEAEVDEFIDRIDEFLAFTDKLGIRSVMMSELTPEKIGASRVSVLPSA